MDEVLVLRTQLETVQEENKRLKQRFVLENAQLKDQLQLLAREVTHLQSLLERQPLVAHKLAARPQSEAAVQCQLDAQIGRASASPRVANVSSPQDRRVTTANSNPIDVQSLSKEADRLVNVINKLRGERLASPSHNPGAVAAASAQALPSLLSS